MSEELLQRNLIKNPEKIGNWDFYNIGATTVKALKEYGIIRNVYYGNIENKKVDALIVQRKNVIAVIEYKKPSEFKTEAQKQKAIDQEIEVAQKLGAKVFIATDTQDSVWVNTFTKNRIGDENGREIKIPFDPKSENIADVLKKIHESINEESDNIKPKDLVNPTDLAKRIWQIVWSVSGATPEKCLYTFVEIFIFKYLSDLGILRGNLGFYGLMEMYKDNSDKQVLEHYARTIRRTIKDDYFPKGEDGTTIINGTIFVTDDQKAAKGFDTVFKTVLQEFEKYAKLENIHRDFKSQLFESFLKESISKKNWGQFFTPLKVIRPIIEMAKDEIKEGVKICDPACGVGKFLLEPLVTKLEEFYNITKTGITPKISIHGFDKGFDKDEQKTIILAKANMLIYFSDLIKQYPDHTKEFSKLFNESFTLKTNSILGTLSEPVENEYDLILTNPPYVTSGSGNLKDEIKKDGDLVNYYKISAMGVEGLFMEWIIKALKPGGKAFIVVPDGILNRQNDKNLRQYLLNECYIDGIISLPIKTFFTTIKKTYILAITKKVNKKYIQIDPVFTYLVSEIGESRDIYRFDIEQDDLQEAATLYSFFRSNKRSFQKINPDKRCKIVEIDIFRKNIEKNWDIDKFWTKKEKIDLGVEENVVFTKLEDFPQMLEEVSCNILFLRDEILELSSPENGSEYSIQYGKFKLLDLFDVVSGNSKLTKSFIENNKGKYPVYSANTKENGIFGYIESFNHDKECIQITTNGVYAGTVFYREKHKFSINGDARLLVKKFDKLDYYYLLFELKKEFKEYHFNWENKPTIGKLKDIEIQIPIDRYGEFDLEVQKGIAEKYKKIESIKSTIALELDKISETEIEL